MKVNITRSGYDPSKGAEHPDNRDETLEDEELPKRLKWTVEIEVDATWVADGIDLTSERVHDILLHAFGWLRSDEVTARTVLAPDRDIVARIMGYKSEADRLARDERYARLREREARDK